jgi:hypothetical protein
MPGIQFSAGTYSTPSNAIRLQNFLLTYNAGGPTSQTGYWTQYPRPSNGWVIYINKATQGPSIYACNNDTDLVNSASQLSNTTISSVDAAINYFNNQTDKIIVGTPLPNISLDGLVFYLDAGIVQSYGRTGTTWTDLSGNGNNVNLINGPTFNSSDGGSIVFDGVNDYAQITTNASFFNLTTSATVFQWVRYQGARTPFFNRSSSNGFWSVSIRPDRSVNIETSTTSDDTPFTLSAAELPSGTWGLLTARWNSDGTMNAFWNGVNRGTLTQSLPSSYAIGGSVLMGWNGNTFYGTGRVGVALIYNRALTNQEILQNYNATKGRFGL